MEGEQSIFSRGKLLAILLMYCLHALSVVGSKPLDDVTP